MMANTFSRKKNQIKNNTRHFVKIIKVNIKYCTSKQTQLASTPTPTKNRRTLKL